MGFQNLCRTYNNELVIMMTKGYMFTIHIKLQMSIKDRPVIHYLAYLGR